MRPWQPPGTSIARLGTLRSLVLIRGSMVGLWRGGKTYKLPGWVRNSKSFAWFEDKHGLPSAAAKFHLACAGGGRQLYIVPDAVTSPHHGLGGGERAAHLLSEFLGRPPQSASAVGMARYQPGTSRYVGDIAVVVYTANKKHLKQKGDFTHTFDRPFPKLYASPAGWYVCGGKYHVNWRGIVQ